MAVPDEPATAAAGEPIGRAALPQRLAALDALVESGTISAADHAAYLEANGDAPPPPSPDDYNRLHDMKVASFNFFRVSVDYVLAVVVTVIHLGWGSIHAQLGGLQRLGQVFHVQWWAKTGRAAVR